MAKDNSIAKGSVTLSVGSMGVFNYALYENKVSPVRQIRLYNHTDQMITGLSLKVCTDSGFFKEWQAPLPPLPAKKGAVEFPGSLTEGHRSMAQNFILNTAFGEPLMFLSHGIRHGFTFSHYMEISRAIYRMLATGILVGGVGRGEGSL